ncbi:hypothetical protein UCMB321_4661 [Pseudomonas batumici]|uniref:Uncharacterized protein n=1 Tax=Pseudomonas batumici TaxID=226910 RepID=A0A0C2E6A3_9PSED|nr:hypothetical protein UCMB321_4661 [Pseudomonas batumici]
MANVIYQWVQMNVLRIPTLVRLLPKACRRKQKGHSGRLKATALGLAVSSSVLEPDGSFPAWTFGANFRT